MTAALLMMIVAFDLASVKSEPNLERRSELALDVVNRSIDAARDSYNAGDQAKMQSALGQASEAADVMYDALSDSGKNPRNSRAFKKAELRTREIIRRLAGIGQSVGVEDRDAFEKLREHVAEIHDNLLKGIMSKKK
jgi:uncharacterized membrane protein YccC